MTKLKIKQNNGMVYIENEKSFTATSRIELKKALDEVRHPLEVAVIGNGSNNEDPNYFNSGAIIRTCHNFLVKKIHLIDRGKFYQKATMGSHKFENINHWTANSFVKEFKDRNIVCLERRESLKTKNLYYYNWPSNPILVFGNEKTGVPNKILNIATDIVSIEQYGINNDFNLATSAGIVIYDFMAKNHPKLYNTKRS